MRNDLSTSLVAVLAALIAWPTPGVRAQDAHDLVRLAIARAVVDDVGATHATVDVMHVSGTVTAPVTAVAEPGARSGRGTRFILWSGRSRTGSAVARVEVTAPHVVARRALGRDDLIGTADVEAVEGPLEDLPLKRLPRLSEVIGTQPRRAISAGEVLTAALVSVPPAVRSGDEVTVTVRSGPVAVSGTGRASGSGHVGDEIRVTRLGTREIRRARITGPGAVEIQP